MKSINKMLTVIILLIAALFITPKKISAQGSHISFQVFYDELSPYGQWMENPAYGYVWFPDAGSNFVPYSTGGYWIMTDYGWTWLSAYNWGWAPFHYGRWDYDNYYGWFWVPDYEWGPAWVNWRHSEGYYGWSPMGPGISVSLSFNMGYNDNYDHWTFIHDRHIGRSNLNHYYVSRADRDRIIVHSTVINNTYVDNSTHTTYVSGPGRDDVQRATGRKVSHIAIQESSNPSQEMSHGNLKIYRPQVSRQNASDQKYVPSRVMNRNAPEQSSDNTKHQPDNNNGKGSNPGINDSDRSRPAQNADQPARNENARQQQPGKEKKSSNFNNTYNNNGATKTINSTTRESDRKGNNNTFNSSRSNRNSTTKSKQQQDASQPQKAESNKQSTPSKQSDNNPGKRQRKSKSETDKKQ